ncbi:MAG: NADPH-dependent F420 reductase [Acidobacteria bacterium]|nr:NADPH-dependent F420 reductase [Acidobacteriota bacterium]
MTSQKVAVIGGTGDQGLGLALRWARAGKHVIIGSRSKERAEEAAKNAASQLGADAHVQGMENAQAAAAASLVVLTVPFEAQIATLAVLKTVLKAGQTLVDVTVPLETSVGGQPTRLVGVWSGSAAEQAARHLPEGVELAAAFHNVSARALQDLDHPVECDVFVCADKQVTRLSLRPWVEAIPDCRYVDGGRLENARIVEAITALLIGVNRRHKVQHAGLRLTGLEP